MKSWYRVEAKAAPSEATVYIHDEISAWGISSDAFVREVAGLDVGTINLHLNTPGGLVHDGIAIYNSLRDHKAAVNVTVDALAASIGSVIAMAGDTVTMGRGSRMMIHNPRGAAIGEAKDMREYADLLDGAANDMAGIYADHAGGDVKDWRSVMDAETWYSAQEAVDAGLADQVSGGDSGAAEGLRRFDLAAYAWYRGGAAAPMLQRNRSRLIRARENARHGGVSQ